MNKNPKLPSGVSAGPGPRGQAIGKGSTPGKGWRICTIWDPQPQTQVYSINDGAAGIVHDVQRLVADPGEVSVLVRGTQVVVHNELGFPVIAAVYKGAATSSVEVNPARVSEVRGVGGEDGVYASRSAASDARAPNDPIDVIPGDWTRRGSSNNMIGVLAGGTNIMSSAPMAQIRTHGVNSMVEVMANVYRHVSSLGNLDIINDGGKTSLIWRAGADQLTECGPNAENWTLRLDAGAVGDLFRFSVTTPNNNTLCELHMSADGRLSLTGVAGIDISSGARGTAREDVAENKDTSILGEKLTVVGGKVTDEFQASRDTLIAQNDTLSVGNDLKEIVGHDRITQVSNTLKTYVEGGSSAPPPAAGNVAVLWDAKNGSIESVTGHNGVPTAKQAQSFVNYAGDFNFAVPSMGKFNLISSTPDSVLLGADGSATSTPAGHTFNASFKSHVMMYEEFKQMMDTLVGWLDSHTHLSAMGPTGPAQGAPTGPASAQVNPKVPPIKSLRVVVGG